MGTNQRLISFDLKAEMGFFKKPDINDGIYLTYNMLHRPVLLGILGAIAGMKGYKENGVLPEYYKRLNHLKIGIKPLEDDKGNYTKDIVSYNNSTGFASNEEGGNLIVTEQILIKPSYRCFLLLNLDIGDEKTLYDNILSYEAEFLPYMGKNDFSAWWTDVREYDPFEKFDFNHDYRIESIFVKTEAVSGYVARSMSMFSKESKEIPFLYFERLPVKLDEKLYQYDYEDFVYSNALFKSEMKMNEAGDFYQIDEDQIIQLFE
ncbi:MAG: type I-B CRISPR-associated protein Cas5b [Bacteroidales bacterium]|nr:type I-B CRISPR-associated protein Cas5b [Bacteroidales bacterium]